MVIPLGRRVTEYGENKQKLCNHIHLVLCCQRKKEFVVCLLDKPLQKSTQDYCSRNRSS